MTDPNRREFKSPEDFRKSLEGKIACTAREWGQDLERVRRKVAFERLLARLFLKPSGAWLLKGGFAMELRFPVVRATQDIDLIIREHIQGVRDISSQHAILERLRTAASIDMGDHFNFIVGESKRLLQGPIYGGARYPIDTMIGRRLFNRFYVDIAVDISPLDPVETISVGGWLADYGFPPVAYHLTNIEQQFAEKLHAYTLPRIGQKNSRVKDLVDMAVLVHRAQIDRGRLKRVMQAFVCKFAKIFDSYPCSSYI